MEAVWSLFWKACYYDPGQDSTGSGLHRIGSRSGHANWVVEPDRTLWNLYAGAIRGTILENGEGFRKTGFDALFYRCSCLEGRNVTL